MKPLFKRILSCISGILFFSYGLAQIPKVVSNEIQNRVDLQINPSIALGVHDSLGDHFFIAGTIDLQKKVKAGKKTLYRLGSLGNTLTGLLTAKLSVTGTIDPRSPLGDLVTPPLPLKDLRGRSISILDVVTYHSGWSDEKGIRISPDANWDALYEEGIPEKIRPYGTAKGFLYSDWAMALLASGLSEYTRTPYRQLIAREVLTPMDLKFTFVRPQVPQDGLATGYSPNNNPAGYQSLSAPTLWWAASTENLLDYGKSLLYPDQAMKKTIDTAWYTYHKDKQGIATGMGWLTDEHGYHYHAGYAKGFNTFIAIDPVHKRVITLATNTDVADITDIGLFLLNPKEHPLEQFLERTPDPQTLASCSGTYINDAMGMKLKLRVVNNTLKVIEQEDTLSLHFSGNYRFFYTGLKASLEFERNGEDQVVGVVLNKNGKQMMFIKTE